MAAGGGSSVKRVFTEIEKGRTQYPRMKDFLLGWKSAFYGDDDETNDDFLRVYKLIILIKCY